MRKVSQADLAYDAISDDWLGFVDLYDTGRRLEVLIDEFLADRIAGRRCLDGGCGLGFFTRRLLDYEPASVTAVDIAGKLVTRLRAELPQVKAMQADLLELDQVISEQFDVVISSEVVEHTPDPERAVRQLCARVRPGGSLAISCPNARWLWILKLAQVLRIRKPYHGYENWVSPGNLLRWIQEAGLVVERTAGIHLVPWHLLPRRLMRRIDSAAEPFSYPVAVNLAVLARR